jgi:ribose transport system permease protein
MNRWKSWLREYGTMLLIWLGLVALFALGSDRFLTRATFASLAAQIPTLTVVAAGMTLVVITAGIDLSVGSVLGLASAVFGVALVNGGLPVPVAALLALLAGAAAGWVNGWVSVRLRVPSFIVTLGMLEVARGLSYILTGSQTKYLGTVLGGLARPWPGLGLPASFLLAVAIVGLLQVVLTRTVFGRRLVAIGTNEEAVRLAGLDVTGPKIAVFALTGLLVGAGALFYLARLGSSDPNAGIGLELSAIAAVVIGGTSLMGGRGSVLSTFLGVLIIATLETGLAQLGASEPLKRVITGSVIIAAAVIDGWRNGGTGGPRRWWRRFFGSGRPE